MRVASALQSPTLLNILGRAEPWTLEVSAMGEDPDLAELSLLELPRCQSTPEMVLVCTGRQLEWVKAVWPDVRCAWVFHNGFEYSLPEAYRGYIHCGVAFSDRVAWLQSAAYDLSVHVIRPAYEPFARWEWTSDCFWAMHNRPTTRTGVRAIPLKAVAKSAGVQWTVYGQDQPAGFAAPQVREALLRRCSAYLSCLPPTAGFGLAEHEALAAGTPVVGGWWGDLEAELGSAYWSLAHRFDEQVDAARWLSETGDGTEELSDRGLAYIRDHCNLRRMNESVEALLDAVR